MSRRISFTRTFLKGHPLEGKPTHFVEKFWKSIGFDYHDLDAQEFLRSINQDRIPLVDEFWRTINLDLEVDYAKHHTIRGGDLWVPNRYFTPDIWSGKPYKAKKIRLAPDQLIHNVWNLEYDGINILPKLNGLKAYSPTVEKIANNDGLQLVDWLDWFEQTDTPKARFKGQIICWSQNIQYP